MISQANKSSDCWTDHALVASTHLVLGDPQWRNAHSLIKDMCLIHPAREVVNKEATLAVSPTIFCLLFMFLFMVLFSRLTVTSPGTLLPSLMYWWMRSPAGYRDGN
ncbi:hypothetical protein FRB91_009795 [Serendipita sp. 411]|nr:hypothetical protein FRB91_009795 [Serendipita sp. 411]